MSNVQLPRLDPQSIKRLAREKAPTYQLYHGGPDWFIERFNGTFYCFPPDRGGEMVVHPMKKGPDGGPFYVKADGILDVRDRYGVIYGKESKEVTHPIYGYAMGRQLPVVDPEGKISEETADNIIKFFTTKFGAEAENPSMSLGITLLTGDPEIDELIKKESRRLWVSAHRAWAEQERRSRIEEIARWKEMNPGRNDIPPMNASQRRAEEILLAAEEDKVVSRLRFVCACGSCETDSEEVFEKHNRIRHPEKFQAPAPVPTAQVVESAPPALPKRPRGRPRKNPLPTATE